MSRRNTTVSVRLDVNGSGEPEASQMPQSPCVQVCRLDEAQVCLGCRRTLAEIVAWPRLSPEDKASLLTELAGRQP